jgi:predicted TIM-barrel fold metal-dependent hydrolase
LVLDGLSDSQNKIIMKTAFLFSLLISFLLAGCGNSFYTEADYPKVLKIDSHVHLNSEKTFFEDQALKDKFKLITLNVDHSDSLSVKEQLKNALSEKQKFPQDVFYGATFYFDTAGWDTDNWSKIVISQLEKNISGGAVSVKVWKNIGMTVRDRRGKFIMMDDPKLDPVIDYIVKKGLPVTGHLGEPRNCWLPLNEMTVSSDSSYFARNTQYHMFLHPEYPSYADQINARDHILEKHPDLIFIGSHLGSLEWNVDELAKRLDKFPNMAVDLSARICHLQYQSAKDRERVRNFCIKYQDRLLYGTDLAESGTGNGEGLAKRIHETWLDDWKYFTSKDEMTSDKFRGKFEGLQLPKEVVDKIFSKNAIKWYKLDVGI